MTALATKDLAVAIADWAIAAAPTLQQAYTSNPVDRGPLPDLAVTVLSANVVGTDPWFPMPGHKLLRRFTIELLIVVDADPPDTANDALTDIADALTEAIIADRLLGGRLAPPGCSPLVQFTTVPDPPELELPDGTICRLGRLLIPVGTYLAAAR